MITRTSCGLRAALAALAALGWWTGVHAQMTPAGTSIDNLATVSYSVGGQAQTPIESSPTGNSTAGPGAGTDTSFLVDNRVDLTVTEVSGNATVTSPGATNAALVFTVTNTGNAPQGYALTFLEEAGTALFLGTDDANVGNLIVRVDEDPSSGNGTGNGSYDGTETATAIDVLNPGQQITVFLVSPTVPLALINGNFANASLTARVALPGTNGGTLATQSAGANDPTQVEILFADDLVNADATESASDQFAIQSAALTITKAQTVLDDGFGSPSPRAIPGATVEYAITIANSSATTAADAVSISDPVPANTAFLAAQYAGEDVGITGGAAATCTADANDADADGCGIAAGTLSVGSAVIGNIAGGAAVTVRFQVEIL
jgi:uncharacterized repeat protein (TIGR01451 family)